MKLRLLLFVGLAVLSPAVARAQLHVGARTGYSFPLGHAQGSTALGDLASGQLPLQLDLGFRPRGTGLVLGGYVDYGFGGAGGDARRTCSELGMTCSTRTLHAGAQVLYELTPPGDPSVNWLGVGVGYEAMTFKAVNSVTVSGLEVLLQGGHDWRIGAGSLGAFASFSVSRYDHGRSGGQSASLTDRALHQWLTLGVRGTFELGG